MALRRPIVASWAMVEKTKLFFFRPRTLAVALCATTLASRSACCAVGGWNPPFCLRTPRIPPISGHV
jgi:hypothetical protein